jgi:uncharacterized membrane protein
MDRKELDGFIAHHGLSPDGIAAAFAITAAEPDRDETARFASVALRVAGVLSLATGLVFFVAANWQDFRVFGRFALLEAVLAGSIAVALFQPPPRALGRYALLMAFVATGALLALFGQTYQTGADVYELFLTWSLVALPFAVAAQWSISWAASLSVLNVALALFCHTSRFGGWLWAMIDSRGLRLAELLLLPTLVNLALWLLLEYLQATRWRSNAPQWLRNYAFASAALFGTYSGLVVILQDDQGMRGTLLAAVVLGACAVGTITHVLRHRRDVFPLAALAGSIIVLTTAAWARYGGLAEMGTLFVVSLWLVGTSTLAGKVLMRLLREWRRAEIDR